MISDSVFPEEELETYKRNALQRLKVNLKKAEFVAGRLIDAYVYGEKHPYGVYTKAEDLQALHVNEIRQFYAKHYLAGNLSIFMAGNFPSDVVDALNGAFGDLPLQPLQNNIAPNQPEPATQKKYRVDNDADAVQGAIRLAMPFPNRHHPDFTKAIVLNNLFGGFFGSRLMSNIREDKGYTYGIHSYIQNHLQTSAWVVSTEAGKKVCEDTLAEIYVEMKKLREEPVDEEELMVVRNYMIGSILGDLDGPFQLIAKWKNIILNGLPFDYFDKSVEAIKTVTPEELMALSNRYLQPENFYELVVY